MIRIFTSLIYFCIVSSALMAQSSSTFSTLLSNQDPNIHFIASVGDVFVSSTSTPTNILSQGYIQYEMDYVGFLIENNTVNFNIYPNPTKDRIFIKINDNASNYVLIDQILLLDYSGKIIDKYSKSTLLLTDAEFNLVGYNAGLYFIQIFYNQSIETIRIIKI